MWAHLGNNFVLDFHEDDLRDVQPAFETTTGVWGRSFQASTFLRPTNSLDVVSTYFMPATAGGDHSLKFGYRWRSAHSTSLNHRGGFVDARFTNGVANSADIWRDQYSESHLDTQRVLRAGHVHEEPVHAEPRPPLRPPGRRGAGGPRAREPVLPDADARD